MGTAGKTWKKAYVPRTEVPTYGTMHSRRLPHERGLASTFQCVDCGAQAYDWSYSGGDPDEIIAQTKMHLGMPYSLKPEFYDPRCRKCHIAFDKGSMCRNGLHSMLDPSNWYIDKKRDSKNCRACRRERAAQRKRIRRTLHP